MLLKILSCIETIALKNLLSLIASVLENPYFVLKKANMTLQKILIDLPSDILLTLNESETELKKLIKSSFAIQLYLQQKVTLGKAAQIAEMSRIEFESLLSENEISISSLNLEDVLNDSKKLK